MWVYWYSSCKGRGVFKETEKENLQRIVNRMEIGRGKLRLNVPKKNLMGLYRE